VDAVDAPRGPGSRTDAPPDARDRTDAPPGTGQIATREIPTFTAIALTTRGPYWKLSGALTRLKVRLVEVGIEPRGPAFGIFYDDPSEVPPEQTRYSICFPIERPASDRSEHPLGPPTALPPAETALGSPNSVDAISLVNVPATPAAVVEYKGPAVDSPRVYEHVLSWIAENAYEPSGPPRERYLAEPGTLGDGLMHVEVVQPLVSVTALGG